MSKNEPARRVASAIQRWLHRIIGQLCFNRIDVGPLPELPNDEPVLYIGLHRNGALDGIPYLQAVPGAAFVVSAQLHRSALGRFLFPGIAVARGKDRARGISADNAAGVDQCIDHLLAGGRLFVMPEGTSSLGPRHLPFKPGAARIAHEVLQRRGTLTVVPLAVHYECAWEWQSRVEVVAGPALFLNRESGDNIDELQARFTRALEQVGINVDSLDELRLIEKLAYGATLGSRRSYAASLQHFAAGIAEPLRSEAAKLEKAADATPALKHQGIPLTPTGSALPYVLLWLALAPLELAFLLSNLPALLAGHLAARHLPDDNNVIAFWRAMVGIPAAALWTTAFGALLFFAWGWIALLAYLVVGLAGLKMFYRFRKLSIALFNRLFAPELKRPLLDFQQALLRSFDDV
jgi:1-acyl-sn-glycerol-3-phosphate acyltransferase